MTWLEIAYLIGVVYFTLLGPGLSRGLVEGGAGHKMSSLQADIWVVIAIIFWPLIILGGLMVQKLK